MERIVTNAEELRNQFYGRTLYEAFFERARRNMKIVLSMDFTNPNFNSNCAANPALFTKCTVIWLGSLGKDSMTHLMNEEL